MSPTNHHRYPFPFRLFVSLAADLVAGRPRSAVEDGEAMWRLAPAPPQIVGLEEIPLDGPLVIAANHCQRRGLWIGWAAALIGSAVAERRHEQVSWLVESELRLMQWRNAGPTIPGSRALLTRVARAYGFIPLPLSGSQARAGGIREARTRLFKERVIGVFPEGSAGRSSSLRRPDPAVDRLLRLLSSSAPVLPVGVMEEAGILTAAFGPPLLHVSGADEVMAEIARLVHEPQRGAYAVPERQPAELSPAGRA